MEEESNALLCAQCLMERPISMGVKSSRNSHMESAFGVGKADTSHSLYQLLTLGKDKKNQWEGS
jgi:hypothetical protein